VTWLAELLVALAIAFLRRWAELEAVRNEERAQLALEAAQLAQRALEWKAAHPVPGGAGGDLRHHLRVSGGAAPADVPADAPRAPGAPGGPAGPRA
jgi:hypothetical protein